MTKGGWGRWTVFVAVVLLAPMGMAPPVRADDPPASGNAPPWASPGAPETLAGETITPAMIHRALLRYRNEPTIRDVVVAARRFGPDLDGPDAMRTRARLRGLLPTLRVGLRRGQGLDIDTQDRTVASYSTDDDLTLTASATFTLGRLAFAGEEVALAREVNHRKRQRRELVETVIALYFERRRLQLERDLLGHHTVAHALRLREITALLNAFTGGSFAGMMNGDDGQSTRVPPVSGRPVGRSPL